MNGAYARLGAALSRMYEQYAEVLRPASSQDPETGETRLTPVTMYGAMPCRISQTALGANGQTAGANIVNYQVKCFYAPEYVLAQGDEVRVGGQVYTAGTPFVYPSHCEVLLERRGWADGQA